MQNGFSKRKTVLLIPVLTALLLTACTGNETYEEHVTASSDTVVSDGDASSQAETAPTLTEIDGDKSDASDTISPTDIEPTYAAEPPYPFSEVDPLLGPGPFSVNELIARFGKPDILYGYHSERLGCDLISAVFDEVMFDLAAEPGVSLRLTTTVGPSDVPEEVLDMPLQTWTASVFSGDLPLPRNLHFGDSIENVYAAYGNDTGTQQTLDGELYGSARREAQGELLISFRYGESGSITYHFADDGQGGYSGLSQVTITWYQQEENLALSPRGDAPPT